MAAIEVPQTLEYRGGQLNVAPVLELENFTNWKKRKPEGQWTGDERKAANLDQRFKSLIMSVLPGNQMNSVINCLTAKSTWDDLMLYKALMNELVNDGSKLSKLEINTGFINGLPKKWLSFCQSLRNINHVNDYELASLFGKLKYEENLIDSIYETKKNKSLVFATPLSTAFISTSIVQEFQDSPDDEEDTRSSHEYLNDLEEEYQARALLAKSKRFFKKAIQRFSSAKATNQTNCHKCGKKGHFARDYWSKALVPSYQSPFQPKPLNSPQHKLELRPTKDFEAKYNKVKAKLALLNEEEVSSDDNEMVEVKVLMALAEKNDAVSKEGARYGEWVKISMRKPNHDTGRILPAESQRNTVDPSVAVTDSLATEYDLADESLVCNTPLPPLKKLDGAEPISGSKTTKLILRIISLEREINPRNPQHAFKRYEAYGSSTHTITDHYDIEWFKRGEALQAKKAEALKSTRAESSNANRSKTPTRRVTCINMRNNHDLKWCLEMTQHASLKDMVQSNVMFDEKRGTIFNSNKEIVMIAPRVRDVYVLDMTSSAQESCFFVKASKNLNWLWHKRLAHLNFKTINKLAKQNLVIGLPSLVYSKDKPCSSCEKGKHHRASFKTKQTSSIKKCLHLLHMDLFGPVTPRSINHEKYTLVIVDEYSRYTWLYFLKKKSQAPETITSFIKRVENQNDIKVKQLKTNNGTEFINSILVNFCDEKWISQNFSSPYTPEQNGVVERKNRTLIEAARIMLSGSVFSKQY
ncbi:retrovirus-related pol polyprotein from transposon TNT 1-94 [Tanacetum coccineum]